MSQLLDIVSQVLHVVNTIKLQEVKQTCCCCSFQNTSAAHKKGPAPKIWWSSRAEPSVLSSPLTPQMVETRDRHYSTPSVLRPAPVEPHQEDELTRDDATTPINIAQRAV